MHLSEVAVSPLSKYNLKFIRLTKMFCVRKKKKKKKKPAPCRPLKSDVFKPGTSEAEMWMQSVLNVSTDHN